MLNTIDQNKVNTYIIDQTSLKYALLYYPQSRNIYYWSIEYTS